MENREKLFLKDCGLLVIRDQCLEANVSFFQEVREVGQLSVGEGIKKKKKMHVLELLSFFISGRREFLG